MTIGGDYPYDIERMDRINDATVNEGAPVDRDIEQAGDYGAPIREHREAATAEDGETTPHEMITTIKRYEVALAAAERDRDAAVEATRQGIAAAIEAERDAQPRAYPYRRGLTEAAGIALRWTP